MSEHQKTDQKQEQEQILNFKTELPLRFTHIPSSVAEAPLLISLHGYTDSPRSLGRRLGDLSDLGYDLLFPAGPFPVPVKARDENQQRYKEAFSWYFFDPETHRIIISPLVAVGMLKGCIEHLGLTNRRKILLGFSQGGFLAPYLAQALTNVSHIIGIGCRYRTEEYRKLDRGIRLLGLQGVEDEIITLKSAEESFNEVLKEGFSGEFHQFAGLAHTMNDASRQVLRNSLKDYLSP